MDVAVILAIIALAGNFIQGVFQYLGRRSSATREDMDLITSKYEKLSSLYEHAVEEMEGKLDKANKTIEKLTKQVEGLKRSLKEEFDLRRRLEKRLAELEG